MKKILFLLFINIYCVLAINAQNNDWIVQFEKDIDPTLVQNKSSLIKSVTQISKSLNVYNIITLNEISKKRVSEIFTNATSISQNLSIERRNVVPNDFLFNDQYSLKIIQADRVWEETTGGQDFNGNDVVIAILDDGFDSNHQDLVDNFWVNNGEIPNDDIDNDGNGYIDDYMGVNIENGSGIHPGVKHGTQVAGIIGAKGDNGMGIAGVNWNSKILLVSGVSNIGQIIKGLEYLYELKKKYIESGGTEGANIVVNNFSGGLRNRFPEEFPSWCDQYDILGTVGILSVGAVANANFDVETDGDLPTLCTSDYLIMVTNTNEADKKVLETAYGKVSVDIGAPGEKIISADIGNDYELISGTSASAPHVAGAIGLLYTIPCEAIVDASIQNPSQFALTIKNSILSGADSITSLEETVSGGRLNIINSVFKLNDLCGALTKDELSIEKISPNFGVLNNLPPQITLTYSTDSFSPHNVYVHDIRGQLIYKDTINPSIFGSRELRFDSNIFKNSGMYVISLESNETLVSSSLVIN